MPPTSPTEHDPISAENDPLIAPQADSNAPVSYVPHDASGAIPHEPVRFRSSRYGELEEHELIRLLDNIEDERARSRFRESIYISCFIWLVIAWVGFYGPRYLWHAPKVINPMDVLKQREMTQLNFSPASPHVSAPPRAAAPPPKLDEKTLERMREMTRTSRAPSVRPAPLSDAPKPATPSNSAPTIPPPTAPTPSVRTPPPVVADAPAPQPTSRPNFDTGSASAGEAIKNALDSAAHNRGGGGIGRDLGRGSHSPLSMGGAEILSDTMGVNFDPYLKRLLADIYRNWMPLIPEEARPPLSKQGEALVRFKILPDGTIGGMWLDGSTHDDAINRSCWGSITAEGQFAPLPSQFKGPNLELRIHFLVNESRDQ